MVSLRRFRGRRGRAKRFVVGEARGEALQGSKTFELDGHPIPYIGKSALIANKKAAGRHKDLADVEELERLKE